jgi:multiple sugar transport system substrate-binding protein
MAKHQQVGDYLDLTPMIQQWPESEQNDLNWSPGWMAASVGGQQVGIATGVHTRTNVYNRDMFAEVGLDPDQPLTTPEEVVEAAKLLTRAEEDRWGLGMYMGPSRATIELYYAPMVWHFGGDFYDVDANSAALTSEASLQATQWLYDLVYTHKVTPPYSYAADAAYDALIDTAFLDGRIAQAMGFGSYWIGTLEEKGMIEGCFPATAECAVGSAGVMVVPTSAKAQFTNAWCLSIHKLSQNPEMAWKLMETVLRPENLATYPDAGLPGRLSAWEAPEYQSDFYQLWLEAARNGRPMPPTPYYPELADTVAAALQEILANQADVAATLQKFEDEWNAKYAG